MLSNIFSFFLERPTDKDKDIQRRKAFAMWFVTNFPASEFDSENRLMWNVVNYMVKLNVPFRERYLDVFIKTDMERIVLKEKLCVGENTFQMFEEVSKHRQIFKITGNFLIGEYNRLMKENGITDDFIVEADAWMQEQQRVLLIDLFRNGAGILSNLNDKKVGVRDAVDYTAFRVALISELYDKVMLEDLDPDYVDNGNGKSYPVTNTLIDPIDRDMGMLMSKRLLGIEAGPGCGKTRVSTGNLSYNAIVEYHKNVLYCTGEQDIGEIEAILISRHIYEKFHKKRIPDSIIYNEKMPDGRAIPKDMQQLIELARQDLFESGRYGKIHIYEKSLYLEDFIEKIKLLDKIHGSFDLIVIDYMTLIQQKGNEKGFRSYSSWEVPKYAYQRFKAYLRKSNKAGIAINQLNAQGVKDTSQGKAPDATGAAGTTETYRSTDYNMTITMTKAMESQGQRGITNTKTRYSKGFGTIVVKVLMDVSYWYMGEQQEVNRKKVG